METSDSKSIRRLAKSQQVIIFLFIVFACSFAAIVLHFSKEGLENNVFWLICGIAVLPLIGFLVFLFVAKTRTIAFNLKKVAEKIQKLSKVIESNSKKTTEEIQKLSKAISKKATEEIQKQLKAISKKATEEIQKLSEDISKKATEEIQKLSEDISIKTTEETERIMSIESKCYRS